jgi:hypothetical protein
MRKKKGNKNESGKVFTLKHELETPFFFAPPEQIKKSLHEVYSVYLQNLETLDFKETATDMYLLHKFFEKAEEVWKK